MLRKLLFLILVTVFSVFTTFSQNELKDGDIIFQTSHSGQSLAIQLATKSPYSHCGIIFFKNGKAQVLEAVQPVKVTPLSKWIKRGDGSHYVIKRLITHKEDLNPAVIKRMHSIGSELVGKNYDLYFGWNDDKIYCSELVWKIYKRGVGIEVGQLKKLKDFDLSSPVVKNILKKRYGNKIPYNETVISPEGIFNSNKLYTVVKK